MKRNFTYKALTGALLALAIALVAHSCHHVDPEIGVQRAIGFSALETKAGATADNIAASGSAFIVRGSASTGSTWASGATTVFDGVTVTSDGTAWTYDPLQYWLPSSAYRFRAVWPASAFGTSGATYTDDLSSGAVITDFTVSPYPDNQVDLLLSELAEVTTDGAGLPSTTSGKVNLQFEHILSNVHLQIYEDTDSNEGADEFEIIGVNLNGMKSKGTYSGTTESGTWNTSSASSLSCVKNFTGKIAPDASGTDAEIWEDGLYLIPQQTANDVNLALDYKVTHGGSTANKSVVIPIPSTEWKAGYKYTYTIALSESYYIVFTDITIEAWGTTQASGTVIIK